MRSYIYARQMKKKTKLILIAGVGLFLFAVVIKLIYWVSYNLVFIGAVVLCAVGLLMLLRDFMQKKRRGR